MKVKFKKDVLNEYRGPNNLYFADGDIKDVSRDEGQRLIKDFPTMFSEVEEKKLVEKKKKSKK
ncbi:MAG: hypothetical protein KAS32_27470 [Candidatus Peribacteraceae bacterium]|nr:hypothetical protein [Candidatus Peribacteraceae bacterium]